MKIFVDVETTGFDYMRDSVLELATIITNDDGEEIDVFHEYCKPDTASKLSFQMIGKDKGAYKINKYARTFQWSANAEAVHGIKYEFAIKQQHAINMSVNWINFLAKHIKKQTPLSMFVSTQAFDLRMITAMLNKNIGHHYFEMYKYVQSDDYENVEKYVPGSYVRAKKQRNLEYIAKHLKIPHKAHNALSDTRATIEIWKRFRNG